MLMYIKTNFNVYRFILFFFLFFTSFISSFAQTFSCNNQVEVDLFGQCDSLLGYELFLESTNVPQDSFAIEIIGSSHSSIEEVTQNQVSETLLYYLTHVSTGNMCWGNLNVTNSIGINLFCPTKTVYCHEYPVISPELIGSATVLNPCFPDSVYIFDYVDNLDNLDCPDNNAFVVQRNWTVIDPNGVEGTCTQTINGEWLTFFDIVFPEDYDDLVNPAFQCNDSLSFVMQTDTSVTGVPLAYGRRLEDFYCEMSATYTDILIPGCGESKEIKRNWTIINFCTNETNTHQQTIKYNDSSAPVFFVPDTLLASTSTNCSANYNLPPADVQFECSDFDVEIETPWETFNTNGGIFEFPPVPGDHIITYRLTDECGNVAEKPVIFKVRQEETLRCPENVTITCKRYFDQYESTLANGVYTNLANLGTPEIDGNCYFLFRDSAVVNVNDCGIGTITHLMSSDDGAFPMNCSQIIVVEHSSDFAVEFPADMTLDCDSGPDGYGQPIIYGDNCERVEIVYEDQIFDIVPDACYKIVRQWTVFNRCISNVDTTNLVAESSESVLGQSFGECDVNNDGSCNNRTFQDGLNADNYPNAQPDGVITYQQVIKIVDNAAPEFVNGCEIPTVCINENTCVTTVILPTPELSECDYRDTWAVSSAMGQGFGPFENISVGTISINFSVVDKCGNSSSCQSVLTVEDCVAPAAFCHPELIVQLNESNDCEVTLNATDVSNGTVDNCLGNLDFSFNADSIITQMSFVQADAPEIPVEIFVTDESGNQSSCSSIITIETDNSCIPPNGEPIAGVIARPNGDAVSDVEVDISINNMTVTTAVSDSLGMYEGAVLFMGTDYVITPTKVDTLISGVTTFDLVILRRHILGDILIDDPYKLIAADVNGSNSITTLDLVNIKKFILNISDGFSVPAWRFIPADYEFPDPTNPWEPVFPEFIQLDGIPPVLDADFIGIKMGDLN